MRDLETTHATFHPVTQDHVIFLLGNAYHSYEAPVQFMSVERLVKQERMSEQGAVDEEVYGEEALGMWSAW